MGVSLDAKSIVLVFEKDQLSLMELNLLSALRELYGVGRVKVFTSISRAELSIVDFPGFIVAVFDGKNADHIDQVFDIHNLFESGVTRVLAINKDQVIGEVELQRFTYEDLIFISETLQGPSMMARLRKVFDTLDDIRPATFDLSANFDPISVPNSQEIH